MRNWIIVLLIFVFPLGVFAWLETNYNKTNAEEVKTASHMVVPTNGKPKMMKFSSPMCSDCKKV